MESQNTPQSEKTVLGVNRSIFLLGIVSFLTDLSSEMIFSVFSIFLTVILGASTALLGIIEGLGGWGKKPEATGTVACLEGSIWASNASGSDSVPVGR